MPLARTVTTPPQLPAQMPHRLVVRSWPSASSSRPTRASPDRFVSLASSGDVPGARTLLASLLTDAERIHGHDHPETADVRELITHLQRLDGGGTLGR